MSDLFEHKGYAGSIEASIKDRCLHGKILFIEDLVTYEAETITDLEAEFIAAVEDYVETCKLINKQPQKPFKGSFNVRVSPELHRKAALEAHKEDISLNELTNKAIQCYLEKDAQPINFSHHEHHYHYEHDRTTSKFTENFKGFGEHPWTVEGTSKLH